ncbi:MAG: hypothetical protein WDL87_08160 [Candidatus Omnitrophota bacterium]|jgi:tetratricopeptide (TPR) repeat protein
MKSKVVDVIFFVFLLYLINGLVGCSNEKAKRQTVYKQFKVLQDIVVRDGMFSEENYSDLCTLGFFAFNDAVAKKDLGGMGYKIDIEKAIKYYEKAILLDKEALRAYKELFCVYDFVGENVKAFENISIAIEKDKGDFDALFILGNFYYKKADYKNAVVWLEKAEKVAEANPRLYGDMDRKGFKKMILKAKMESSKNPRP